VFKEVLGGGIDSWVLQDVFTLLPVLREHLKQLRESGLSEDDSVAAVIQSLKKTFGMMAARGCFYYEQTRGRVSLQEPGASLPLGYVERLRLEIRTKHLLAWDHTIPNEDPRMNSLGARVSLRRDLMTPETIERAVSSLDEQTRLKISLSGLTPWGSVAPLLPAQGWTKLDLILEFLQARHQRSTEPDTNEEVSIRGGRNYLTGYRCPRRVELVNAFNEWRSKKSGATQKTHRRRADKLPSQIDARYLFPQLNTYTLSHLRSDRVPLP
jgi:hypothetical protein